MSVLTKSMKGLDYKLKIILNKADTFKSIKDFSRAYGTLCWNLSKVMPVKDLPIIYTMRLPVGEIGRPEGSASPGQLSDSHTFLQGAGIDELDATREEIVLECVKAPQRRVDNEITRLGPIVI